METEKKDRRALYGAITLAMAAILFVVDQGIKQLVVSYFKTGGAFTVIPGLLEFSYVENSGAAFGLFQSIMWLVMATTIISCVIIVVLLFRYRRHDFLSYAAAAMVLSGGLGNMMDRSIYGFVVDFIHVMFFDYVFNFADCCITVGAALFVLHVILLSGREKKQKAEREERA